jgi:hypothetical protein
MIEYNDMRQKPPEDLQREAVLRGPIGCSYSFFNVPIVTWLGCQWRVVTYAGSCTRYCGLG